MSGLRRPADKEDEVESLACSLEKFLELNKEKQQIDQNKQHRSTHVSFGADVFNAICEGSLTFSGEKRKVIRQQTTIVPAASPAMNHESVPKRSVDDAPVRAFFSISFRSSAAWRSFSSLSLFMREPEAK